MGHICEGDCPDETQPDAYDPYCPQCVDDRRLASERNKPSQEVAPDCRTCEHCLPPLSFAGEPACEFSNSESIIVCINGDGFVPAAPIRLYATGGDSDSTG